MENQAHLAKSTRLSIQTSLFPNSKDAMPTAGIDFREATVKMHIKYANVDKAIRGGLQPYHPLSLTFYEPLDGQERFRWLRDLQLSVPVALLKVAVGAQVGILAWVMKRDPDIAEIGDIEEVEAARVLIQPLIPRVRMCTHGMSHVWSRSVAFAYPHF